MSEASRARQLARVMAGDHVPEPRPPKPHRQKGALTQDQILSLREMSNRGHIPGLRHAVGKDTYLVAPTGAWIKQPSDLSQLPQGGGSWRKEMRTARPGKLPRL